MSRLIALVGGGGKTTTMSYLADKEAKNGKRAIITTTTHIQRLDGFVSIDMASELKSYKWTDKPLVIGVDEGKKLSSISLAEIERLKDYSDIVFIEADGAKRLPIKVPNMTEPVIPKNVDTVIICMGIDAIGKTIKEKCFRYEIAKSLYGLSDEQIITEELAAIILTDDRAGLKGIEKNHRIHYIINKVDDEEKLIMADLVKEKIMKRLISKGLQANVESVSYFNSRFPKNII